MQKPTAATKIAYEPPVIRVVGSFLSLTQHNVKMHGKVDGWAFFASPLHNTSP